MSSIKKIIKRDGRVVDFDPNQLIKWATWAASMGIDWFEIVTKAYERCPDMCTTKDLQYAMIDACNEKDTTKHAKMAGRLLIGDLFKQAFGGHRYIPKLKDHYLKMVEIGMMEVLPYDDSEWEYFESIINHELDRDQTYTEVKQFMNKYALQDKVRGKVFESPQFTLMRMALGNMKSMPKERRANDVYKLYKFLSEKKINPPTPNYMNLGTNMRGYASCCVFKSGDSANSLAVGDHIAYIMTCASAGIGGTIITRSKGDKVRNGTIKHMGKLSYYRTQQASVLANLQNGRGGALTLHYTCLDPEIEDIIKLRNPTTVVEKRIKDIDYSFGYNYHFAKMVNDRKEWMLVSYGDAPELYNLLYSSDREAFVKEYESVKSNPKIKKKFVDATELISSVLTESIENRHYVYATDEMNRHTPFKATIWSSNLCQEIGLPTKEYSHITELYKEESDGEIGLCNLAAIVAGRVSPEEYEEVAYYTLLMIDNIIDLMDYPFPSLKHTATSRRSVGVGITNLAYDMAVRGLRYSTVSGKRYIYKLAELHSFSLHKASLRLAKERGVAPWIDKTKYVDGWLPIDSANKTVSTKYGFKLQQDWETLRTEIKEFGGIRHSVLEAFMPNESSSQATGTTNSIYPIRSIVTIKPAGTSINRFLAPDADSLYNDYELAWDIRTEDLIECYALVQEHTGQAISADFYCKFEDNEVRKIGSKRLVSEWLYATKVGLKTRYYYNSAAGAKLNEVQSGVCTSGGCTL